MNCAFPCPCCGYMTFAEPPGSFDICDICHWEDDRLQLRLPMMGGGANSMSLMEAQVSFLATGAKGPKPAWTKHYGRLPSDGEVRDTDWRPLDLTRDVFESPVGERKRPWPDDLTLLYWWRDSYWLKS